MEDYNRSAVFCQEAFPGCAWKQSLSPVGGTNVVTELLDPEGRRGKQMPRKRQNGETQWQLNSKEVRKGCSLPDLFFLSH
jgi:hypothetical protein